MACFGLGYQINMFGCEDPTAGLISSVLGTAPISVSTVAGVATVSHDNIGTAGTYAYPSSITTDAKGHVSAITAGSAPITGIWTPTTLGAYYGFNSVNPYLETGVGYNVGISGTGDTVVGNGSTTGVASSNSVVVGRGSSAASTGDVVVGSTSTAINASGGPRVLIGQTVVFTSSLEAVAIGYLGSGSGNDYFTGIGSRISCTANKVRSTVVGSTNTMQYDRAVMVGYGNGNNGTDATSVGYQAAAAQDSAALGSGATAGNTNCVALGKGATTTANDELCTGSQTRLRFPSLSQAAAGANSYAMLWDSSTKVCVPATIGYGTFTSFTTTWTNISQGNGTQDCRYVRFGNLVFAQWKLTFGNTTSVSGNMAASLPITADKSQGNDGFCHGFDNSGGASWTSFADTNNGTTIVYAYTPGSYYWNATQPFTWALNDVFCMSLWYRV